MRIGAHVSASGGIENAIDRALDIGAETIQIFGSGPQMWRYKPPSADHVRTFVQKARENDIKPVFLHAIYLINLGTPDTANLEKGITSLVSYMKLAADIEAEGVIFHGGSHRGAGFDGVLPQTVSSLKRVLDESPLGPWLILENSAGMGNHIGASFHEMRRVLEGVNSDRMRVCFDTMHAFAAGYDVATKEGLGATLAEFDRELGLSNLIAIHANDAKTEFRSGVDRHENIGEGYIGIAGFESIMGHTALREIPFILEVPGFDQLGPDQRNVAILKSIRDRLGIPV
jgi:deoxyribonuclease-4